MQKAKRGGGLPLFWSGEEDRKPKEKGGEESGLFCCKRRELGLAERGECRELHEQKGVLIFYFESLKGSLGLIIGGRDPRASFFFVFIIQNVLFSHLCSHDLKKWKCLFDKKKKLRGIILVYPIGFSRPMHFP